MMAFKKCRNCSEPIDKFIGETSKASVWLHVIKYAPNDKEGCLWGWSEESKKYCRNPEPKGNKK